VTREPVATEVPESKWSRGRELNPRPTDYESVALPLSYPGFLGTYATGESDSTTVVLILC
jgi:hypothetical protein